MIHYIGRWGRRQARGIDNWEQRWQGVAQYGAGQVRMFWEEGFDAEMAWLYGWQTRKDWRLRWRWLYEACNVCG